MKIVGDKITVTFKAGEALADGDVVYVSAAGEVSKAATANAPKVVGVADAAAAAGENVDVVIYGKKTVTADGAIAVGDRLRAADTAGRIISENSVTPTFTGDALAGHSHKGFSSGGTDVTLGAHQQVVDGAGTSTTLQCGVNTAGQAAVNVPTSSVSGGTPSGAVSAVEHGRIVGKALGAAAASEALEILVCLA